MKMIIFNYTNSWQCEHGGRASHKLCEHGGPGHLCKVNIITLGCLLSTPIIVSLPSPVFVTVSCMLMFTPECLLWWWRVLSPAPVQETWTLPGYNNIMAALDTLVESRSLGHCRSSPIFIFGFLVHSECANVLLPPWFHHLCSLNCSASQGE